LLLAQKNKAVIQKAKIKNKKHNEYSLKYDVICFKLSNNALKHITTNLMHHYYYKTIPATHIHIDCYNSHQ